MEWYKAYRPRRLEDVFGNQAAKTILEQMLRQKQVPQFLLFTGPSGCGKTTLARLLLPHLNCDPRDFKEVNCADFRGVDMVREIRRVLTIAPWGGRDATKVYLIDEAHQLTRDAQNAFLKILEDTPKGVHFMLATTDPKKLLDTIHTRATEIKTGKLRDKEMQSLLGWVLGKEKVEVSEEVLDRVTERAEGSPRKALVLLEAVARLEDEDAQLAALDAADSRAQGFELAQLLISRPGVRWPEVASLLKRLDGDDEQIRHIILSYATKTLLGGGKTAPRAYLAIRCFEKNWYDSKRAGLVAACYEMVCEE